MPYCFGNLPGRKFSSHKCLLPGFSTLCENRCLVLLPCLPVFDKSLTNVVGSITQKSFNGQARQAILASSSAFCRSTMLLSAASAAPLILSALPMSCIFPAPRNRLAAPANRAVFSSNLFLPAKLPECARCRCSS